jgi:hypothetical protein
VESWTHTLAELARDRAAALKRHAFLLSGDDSQAEDLPTALGPGTDRQLSVEWAWSNQAGPALAERIVAELAVQNPAGG